jgi:hypothetical protein
MRITFTRASEDRQLREWEYHQDMMMDEDDRPEWVCEPDDDCTKAKCARCKRGRI